MTLYQEIPTLIRLLLPFWINEVGRFVEKSIFLGKFTYVTLYLARSNFNLLIQRVVLWDERNMMLWNFWQLSVECLKLKIIWHDLKKKSNFFEKLFNIWSRWTNVITIKSMINFNFLFICSVILVDILYMFIKIRKCICCLYLIYACLTCNFINP